MLPQRLGVDLAALLRFAAGGVLSATVTIGGAALLHEAFGVSAAVAPAVGLAGALITNFLFSRWYVFRGSTRPFVPQLAMFLASSGVFRATEYGAFLMLHWFGVHYLAALIMVLGSSFGVKFLVYDRFLFARGPGGDTCTAASSSVHDPDFQRHGMPAHKVM